MFYLFVVILALLGFSPAQAQMIDLSTGQPIASGGPIAPQCVHTVDNGCAAALSAQVGSQAAANFLGEAARNPSGVLNELGGTTTNYATNGPDENLPDINYPTGETMPISSLADPNPASGSVLPIGCSYNPVGSASLGPVVNCVHPTFDGQTYSGWMHGSIGGHGCTALSITGTPATSTGSSTISQNNFLNDTGDCAVNQFSPEQVDDNTVLNGTFTDNFTNNSFIGNGDTFNDFVGPNANCTVAPLLLACNPAQQAVIVGANQIFTYNHFEKYFGRPIQYNSGLGATQPTVGLVFDKNSFIGCCFYYPGLHAELIEFAGGPGVPLDVEGNTLIITPAHNTHGDAFIPANFTNNVNITTPYQGPLTIANNFIIHGLTGAQEPSATWTGHVNASSNALVVDTLSAGALMTNGQGVSCNGSALAGETMFAGSTGTTTDPNSGGTTGGVGSTWPINIDNAADKAFIGITGSVSSTTLTVSANSLVDLTIPFMQVQIPGITPLLNVGTQLSGPTGDTGTYVLGGGVAPTVSQTITSAGSGGTTGTHTNVKATPISGVGIGAIFTVIINGSGQVTSAVATTAGQAYFIGDTYQLPAGATGAGATITIASISGLPATIGSTAISAFPNGGSPAEYWKTPATGGATGCSGTTVSAPFSDAGSRMVNTGYSQLSFYGNYFDMTGFGPGNAASVWHQISSTVNTFVVTIDNGSGSAGNTLTLVGVMATTPTVKGTGYSSATVSYSGGSCSPVPTATANLSSGIVNTITQNTNGVCPTGAPTASISAPQGGTFTGSVTSNVLTVSTTPTLSVVLVPGTTQLTSLSGSPTLGTQISGVTGGTGTYNLTTANVSTTTITASGVQATAAAAMFTGNALVIDQTIVGSGIAIPTPVSAGSGNVWTVLGSPQLVGPVAAHSWSTWCLNPTIFNAGGLGPNVDMSSVGNVNMNTLVGQPLNNGC